MSISLAAINALRLEELRDTFKTLRGDKWKESVEEYRPVIEDIMVAQGCDVLPAAIILSKKLREMGSSIAAG